VKKKEIDKIIAQTGDLDAPFCRNSIINKNAQNAVPVQFTRVGAVVRLAQPAGF